MDFDLSSGGLPIDGMNGAGKKISSMVVCRVFRNTSNANDTYSGDVGLLEIDFHYMQCGNGSNQQYIK